MTRTWRILCLLLWINIVGWLAACNMQPVGLNPTLTPYPTVGEVQYLNVVCADFLEPTLRVLAAAYQRQHPQVIITVVQRADTLGYPLLTQGGVDMAFLTWLPDNRSETTWVQEIAFDGLAIIVHPQNGVPGLSLAQIQKLFQGQVEDWQGWGGLPGVPQLISRETASGEFLYLQNHVMREIRASLNASLATDTVIMRQYVANDPLAVGYLSSAWLDSTIRAVAVEGVPPNSETISSRLYPLTREIMAVSVNEPSEPARGFLQWILEPEGQTILALQGFVPVVD